MAEFDIRVVRVQLGRTADTEKLEKELAELRRQGFEWATAGGGTGKVLADISGFIVMERPKPQ